MACERLGHAPRHRSHGRFVKDDFAARHRPRHAGLVAYIAGDQLHVVRNADEIVELARAEIVKHAHLVPPTNEGRDNVGADEAGAAGDKINGHLNQVAMQPSTRAPAARKLASELCASLVSTAPRRTTK